MTACVRKVRKRVAPGGLGPLTKLRWLWVADNPLPDGAPMVRPERAWVDER